MGAPRKPKQTTPKGLEISVPTRDEFLGLVKKVAGRSEEAQLVEKALRR